MAHTTLHGGCLCGSVRYEIRAPLGTAEHCHCAMCRKAHGAAFSTNALVSTEALVVTAGAEFIREYHSSTNRQKCFCGKCGSQLFIRRLDKRALTVVTLGSIDNDPQQLGTVQPNTIAVQYAQRISRDSSRKPVW